MAAATSRFRASARPFVLFAAGRRAADRAAGGACEEGPPAGAGADRHRQHVRRAGILREDGGRRHPADCRLRARRRFRRPGQSPRRDGAGFCAHRAACRARGGLPEPDAALLARLSRYRAVGAAAHQAVVAGGSRRRPDRAQRRTERSARHRDRRRAGRAVRSRAARNCSGCSATASTSSCSATACRPSGWPSRR